MPELSMRNRTRSRITAALSLRTARWLGMTADKIRNVAQNANNWDLELNGEAYTIARACPAGSGCIFDVGSNEGSWAAEALRLAPRSEVHCFEPVPDTFASASLRLGDDARIVLNNLGLGAAEGRETFSVGANASELASKYLQDPHYVVGHTDRLDVVIQTGDQYVVDHGISQIDLLKIDVEGMELEVLRGFEATLRRRAISVIQFEYGVGYIGARTFLQDVFVYLESMDFNVCEVRPKAWQPVEYHFSREDFNPRNFVAVLRTSANSNASSRA